VVHVDRWKAGWTRREGLVEAGHRCAIPTCRAAEPLEYEHIDDWAKVKKHEFANMIVLCRNCHGRKGSRPTEIAESRPGLSVALIARGELGARLSAGARGHLRQACDRLGITVLEHTVEAVEATRVLCADGRRDGILQTIDDEGQAKPTYQGGRKPARIKAGILKMALWATSHPTYGLPKRKHRLAAAPDASHREGGRMTASRGPRAQHRH
jgi:hypothetical protein